MLSICLAGVSLMATITYTNAMPLAGGNSDFEYAIKGREHGRLTAGLWGGSVKREIAWDNGRNDVLESTPVDLYIGFNIVEWFDLIGIVGSRGSDFDVMGKGKSQGEWGFGFQARLFTHNIPEIALVTDTIRLTANASWINAGTEVNGRSENWSETSASLLLGIYNFTEGNKLFGPENIGIYAGPAFSALQGENFSESESIGAIVGLQIFMTDSMGLEIQGQIFEETSVIGGLSYHF